MPLSSDPPPSTSRAVDVVYDDVLHPLFFPPPEDYIQPILDSFVNVHDPVLDDNTVFSARARIREAGVELDALLRECRRLDQQTPDASRQASSEEVITLEEVRKTRLRSRLQAQAQTTPSQTLTRNEILKQAKERREKFDEEMRQAEEDALNDFKEGLRKAVVL